MTGQAEGQSPAVRSCLSFFYLHHQTLSQPSHGNKPCAYIRETNHLLVLCTQSNLFLTKPPKLQLQLDSSAAVCQHAIIMVMIWMIAQWHGKVHVHTHLHGPVGWHLHFFFALLHTTSLNRFQATFARARAHLPSALFLYAILCFSLIFRSVLL